MLSINIADTEIFQIHCWLTGVNPFERFFLKNKWFELKPWWNCIVQVYAHHLRVAVYHNPEYEQNVHAILKMICGPNLGPSHNLLRCWIHKCLQMYGTEKSPCNWYLLQTIRTINQCLYLSANAHYKAINTKHSDFVLSSANTRGWKPGCMQGCARFRAFVTIYSWTQRNWEFRRHRKWRLNRQFQNYRAQTP